MQPRGPDDEVLARGKSVLRHAVRLRRDSRSQAQRAADDEARLEVLTAAVAQRSPGTVAAYHSSGSEPGTLQVVAWLAARDVRVLLPVLTGNSAEAQPGPAWAAYAGPDALRVGRQHILEPTGPALPARALSGADLIICPGLAANRQGDRLGRGGGWYDRALGYAAPGTPVWVLLNDDEVLEAIPVQSWDRPVTALVAPSGALACSPAPPGD